MKCEVEGGNEVATNVQYTAWVLDHEPERGEK